MSDTIARTTIKTILYRVLGSLVTFIVAFLFTGEFVVSASISITEFVIKPAFYWIYERFWNRVPWGKIEK